MAAFSSGLRENAPRKAEFESLDHGRGSPFSRFADRQVNVLGHDHVSNDDELIALANLFEHGKKQVATFLCFEEGTALMTTAGNKVKVSGAVKMFWLAVHTKK